MGSCSCSLDHNCLSRQLTGSFPTFPTCNPAPTASAMLQGTRKTKYDAPAPGAPQTGLLPGLWWLTPHQDSTCPSSLLCIPAFLLAHDKRSPRGCTKGVAPKTSIWEDNKRAVPRGEATAQERAIASAPSALGHSPSSLALSTRTVRSDVPQDLPLTMGLLSAHAGQSHGSLGERSVLSHKKRTPGMKGLGSSKKETASSHGQAV